MQPGEDVAGQNVTAGNVDLSNCDRERIHAPGLIQPHGALLVLRPSDLAILQASENMLDLFGVAAADLLNKGLPGLFDREQVKALQSAIARAGDRLDRGPFHLLGLPPNQAGKTIDALAHRAGDVLILELEVRAVVYQPSNLLPDVEACVALLRATKTLAEFLDAAVTQIGQFSGFDRVMAYQFAEDGSGEVVAEAKRDELTGYLGLHFPASDIPAPARRLFALSWLRHLPNVDYVPVRMLPETAPEADMSRAILRHVSVMYSSYLKNMQVHSTMVMPLMKGGRLWGLMSCMHHASPLQLPWETRTVIEVLAQMVSLLMAEHEDLETASYRSHMKESIAGLERQMVREPVFHRGLSNGPVPLLGWLDAAGAALVTENGTMLFGDTPTEGEVAGIVSWFNERAEFQPVFVTDRLPQIYPAAKDFSSATRGLLAIRMVRSRLDFVMWFRPEIVQTIDWAGDPQKPVQVDVVDGEARLTPRGSFALWRQTLPGRSEPWQTCEIEAAGALRQAIAEVLLVRLNDDLGRSNVELDAFAHVASHDLKEPLRGIHNYAHFLQRSAAHKLTEEELGRIDTIIRLTRRMDDLTDSLMQYSHIGRAEYSFELVDMNDLLRQTLKQLDPRITETGTIISVPRPLPDVTSDPMRLAEVLSNLIVNAMKYSNLPRGEGRIEIGWREEVGRNVFYVRDNGIGIAEGDLEHVFKIFRRLHSREEYGGGSGAGLTIARRTVERLGGSLWAESEGLGHGATFLFSLRNGALEARAA